MLKRKPLSSLNLSNKGYVWPLQLGLAKVKERLPYSCDSTYEEKEALKIADKICGLRIFEDEAGKMNVNPATGGAQLLMISQFTLFADCKSRRPGFSKAARRKSHTAERKGHSRVPQPRLRGRNRRVRRGNEGRIDKRRTCHHYS